MFKENILQNARPTVREEYRKPLDTTESRVRVLERRAISAEKKFVDGEEPMLFVTLSFRYTTGKNKAKRELELFLARLARKKMPRDGRLKIHTRSEGFGKHLKAFYYGDLQPNRFSDGEKCWHWHLFIWVEGGLNGRAKNLFRKWRFGNVEIDYYDSERHGVTYSRAKHDIDETHITLWCPKLEHKCRKVFGGKCKYGASESDRVQTSKPDGRKGRSKNRKRVGEIAHRASSERVL